jgi:hypothetical protein
MSESTTIEPTTLEPDAVGVAPSPPSRARRYEPTHPVPIPEGDPSTAALALLASVRPDAPAVLRSRIQSIDGELDGHVEAARTNERMSLANYVSLVSRRVILRSTLRARAGEAVGRTVEGEVLDLVKAVRRWRTGDGLKAERARIVGQIRAELRTAEESLQALAASFARGAELTIGAGGEHHRTTGLTHQHDEFLRRAEALLSSRETLRARLARLDGLGDAGRADQARAAVEAAGGVDDLVEVLAPSMPSADSAEVPKLKRDVDGLASQLGRIDPDSRLAAELAARLATLEARREELASLAAKQRTAAAGSLVASALAGGLPAIQALESAVRTVRPELAEQLARLRGEEAELLATVAEMIGS